MRDDLQQPAREALQSVAVELPDMLRGVGIDAEIRTAAHMGIADALEGIAAALMAGVLLQARRDGLTPSQAATVIHAGYLHSGFEAPGFTEESRE